MSEETQKPKQSDAEESDEKNSEGDRSPVTTERALSDNQAPTGDPQTDPKDTGDKRGSTESESPGTVDRGAPQIDPKDDTEENRRPSVTESPGTVDRGAEGSESKPIAPEDQPEEKIDNGSND